MRKICSLVLFLFLSHSYGQTQIKKSNISTGGGSTSTGDITVIYSVGEVAVQEKIQGNTHLSEGFVGPDLNAVLGVNDYGVLSGFYVLPNPVKDRLYIRWEHPGDYEIYLFDLNGKELLNSKVTSQEETSYNLSKYASAIYLLFVIDREKQLSKQIKIIKK